MSRRQWSDIQEELSLSMGAAHKALEKNFAGLRTGRANPALLESLGVDVYGAKMPLDQLSTISVAESRTLTVRLWDASNAPAVEKALMNAGYNPQTEGALLRIHLPELTQETRLKLVKQAKDLAEETKVVLRRQRRDILDTLNKKDYPEDEYHQFQEKIQDITDKYIGDVTKILDLKEKEILKV